MTPTLFRFPRLRKRGRGNAGPARIPSAHQAVLGYCQDLGVALEVEINTSSRARAWANTWHRRAAALLCEGFATLIGRHCSQVEPVISSPNAHTGGKRRAPNGR